MKLKLSNKDLLLLCGIIVAVIIALTTLVFREMPSDTEKSSGIEITPKIGLENSHSGFLKKAIEKVHMD